MNVLAIGAHFDDIELGCGGSLARHVAAGDEVYAYVATRSSFSDGRGRVLRSAEVALAEGREALAHLGVTLFCGPFETFEVEFDERLDKGLVEIVEQRRIERVYTHWAGDAHHDHCAVARASLHACRHVPNVLAYRSNWYHSSGDFRGRFYVDITRFWPAKQRAIEAHRSELERTGGRWLSYCKREAESAGQRIGVEYAEVFEVVKWLER